MIQHTFRLFAALAFFLSTFPAIAQETTLNAAWQFVQNDTLEIEDIEKAKGWHLVNLPHTWNQYDAFDEEDGYKSGSGWYRKALYLPRTEHNRVFLNFEGANQHTTVYVNGRKAGEHVGGYTAFVVDITEQALFDAHNIIAIKVDNRYNKAIPPLSADFTFYGGIYRDLWLIRKTEQFFDLTDGSTKGVYLSTPEVSEQQAQLKVLAKARNKAARSLELTVEAKLFSPQGRMIEQKSEKMTIGGGQAGQSELTFEVNAPTLWTPDSPSLYRIELYLKDASGKAIDWFTTERGFRWVEMNKKRALLLNGKPLKLIGTNHHQDYPGLGNALPDDLHRRDIQILKDMGANFLRIAHYPQDPALLAACDELGILTWEEIPIVNSITVSEAFQKHSEQMLREMIRQHYNHTSVIMWGYMNEVLLRVNNGLKGNPGIEEEAYLKAVEKLTKELNAVAKEEDPGRWTTIAHHGNYELYEDAGMNDITDIVGWNLYYGWYSEDMPKAGEFLDRFHQDHPDKGIIIAEYGGGSDPRIHAIDPVRFDFSIEWQTAIHASYYQQMLARPHVMGGTVWNFADFGSEGRKDAVPHINSKGILHFDRTPKDSYFYYQAALSEEPYLKIGSNDWRERAGFAKVNGLLIQPVFIFSNQPTVKVHLNGEALGEFIVTNFYTKVDIPFRQGKNNLTVKAGKGLEEEALFHASLFPDGFSSIAPRTINLNMNLGAHFYYIDEITKEIWIPEQPYRKGSLGYVDGTRLMSWGGFRVGTDKEIFGTDNEPIYQTHRDSITAFRADVPDGWYEVSLHFAEIYSQSEREKLAYNLGAEGEETTVATGRLFHVNINGERVLSAVELKDFQATEYRFQAHAAEGKGILVEFQNQRGSAFLSGISVRGL